MRKLSAIIFIGMTLTACTPTEPEIMATKIDYICPMDTNFTIEFSQNGKVAKLFDQADRVFILKNSPAASGAYYKDNEGVSIHTKGDEAIIELVKNRPIRCKEWKEN